MSERASIKIGPVALTASRTNLASPVPGMLAAIGHLRITNNDSEYGTFSLWIGKSKAGKRGTEIAYNVIVAAGNRYDMSMPPMALYPGEYLVGRCRGARMVIECIGFTTPIDPVKAENHALRVESNDLKAKIKRLKLRPGRKS